MDDSNYNQQSQAQQDTSAVAQQPQSPVGSFQKENEPLGQFVKHSEPEPVISPELSEHGVRAVNQQVPNLSEEVKNAGVTHAPEIVPANLNPSTNIPLTAAQASLSKKSGVGNSISWLSTLVLKVLGV